MDLTFRYLPDLYKLARNAAQQDVLLTHLARWAVDWPLSSLVQDAIDKSGAPAAGGRHPSTRAGRGSTGRRKPVGSVMPDAVPTELKDKRIQSRQGVANALITVGVAGIVVQAITVIAAAHYQSLLGFIFSFLASLIDTPLNAIGFPTTYTRVANLPRPAGDIAIRRIVDIVITLCFIALPVGIGLKTAATTPVKELQGTEES